VIEAVGFRDEFQTYNKNNIQVIGCSGDSPKKQKKFVEKYDLPFPMLCDEGHEMLRDYKMWVKKKFMGKEYMGIYRGSYLIDEKGMIEKVYEKVAVKSHTKEVLEDLS
jgi:peroxiredoxin Q/BCP